jgi:hypothetical protein
MFENKDFIIIFMQQTLPPQFNKKKQKNALFFWACGDWNSLIIIKRSLIFF